LFEGAVYHSIFCFRLFWNLMIAGYRFVAYHEAAGWCWK